MFLFMTTPGDFSTLDFSVQEKELLTALYSAVTELNYWEYMKGEPSGGNFTYTPDIQFRQVMAKVGTGYDHIMIGVCARIIQRIARTGWKEWEPITSKRTEFLALPNDMTLTQQFRAIAEHQNTRMTYAEMRERFG